MILVILQLLIPMMAVLLLDSLWKSEELQGTSKFHFGVLGGVVALGFVLYAMPSISGDFITTEELKQFSDYAKQSKDPSQLTMIEGLKGELKNVRQAIYKADAGRTLLFFIGTGVAILLAFYKVNRWVWLGLIGVFVAVDEINVDLRYLNADPIEEMSEELAKYEDRSAGQIPYMPEKSDAFILTKEAGLLP